MPIDSPLRRSSSAIFVKSAPSVPWPATWTVKPSPAPSDAMERSCSIVVSLSFFRGTVISAARLSPDTNAAAASGELCFAS